MPKYEAGPELDALVGPAMGVEETYQRASEDGDLVVRKGHKPYSREWAAAGPALEWLSEHSDGGEGVVLRAPSGYHPDTWEIVDGRTRLAAGVIGQHAIALAVVAWREAHPDG